MQNIHELLSGIGLSVPDEKKGDFEKSFKENYKTVAEVAKIQTDRDTYKGQLDTVSSQLKAFEGVDIDDLKGQIATLNKTITDNEAKHREQLDTISFEDDLREIVKEAKGRSVTAVKAFLDIPALMSSKNRTDDLRTAVEQLKAKENRKFLFEPDEKSPEIAVFTKPHATPSETKAYMDDFYKNNPFYHKK